MPGTLFIKTKPVPMRLKISQLVIFWLLIIAAQAQPVANFSAAPVSGCAPLVVNFSDQSTGVPTAWTWDLGNGTTSILKNPSVTYLYPGVYRVRLTATNAAGNNTIVKDSFIRVYAAPAVNEEEPFNSPPAPPPPPPEPPPAAPPAL